MNRLTIGMFSPDFAYKGPFQRTNTTWGGVGEVIYQLSCELAERGHRVKIFTVSDQWRHDINGLVELIEYPATIPIAEQGVSIPYLICPLTRDVDIIHVHRGLPSGAISGYLYSKINDKPMVFTCHGEINKAGKSNLVSSLLSAFEWYSKRILSHSDSITTVSKSFLKDSDYLQGYEKRTVVIPNGVNTSKHNLKEREAREALSLPKDEKIILFMGSLVKRKNPSLVLEIADYVNKNIRSKVNVLMTGTGDQKATLVKQAEKIEEVDIMFPGFVSEHDKMLQLIASDIFVQPSSDESFGLTVLEALGFGLPVIATNLPCFQELITYGKNGYTCESVSEMSKLTAALLDDQDHLKKMGRAALTSAEGYSWESIASQYLEVYNQIQ